MSKILVDKLPYKGCGRCPILDIGCQCILSNDDKQCPEFYEEERYKSERKMTECFFLKEKSK